MEGRRAEIREGSVRDPATPRGCLSAVDEERGAAGERGRQDGVGTAWGMRAAGLEEAGSKDGAGKQGAIGAEAGNRGTCRLLPAAR